MQSKSPIIPERVRRISGSFSWLDHRLLHHGFLQSMQPEEMLLYFFMVLVGDKNGVSYYGYDAIINLLKLTLDQFITARDRLIDMSLIAFKDGRYQVLELPKAPCCKHLPRSHQVMGFKEILEGVCRSSP